MPPLNPRSGHLGLILPLCTSSATVGMSLLQYPLFFAFLRSSTTNDVQKSEGTKPHDRISGRALSCFWDSFLAPAGSLIAGVALTSTASGFVANRWLRSHATLETTAVSKWYAYGAALALGHLAFVPLVAGPILKITEAVKSSGKTDREIKEVNENALRAWLNWHTSKSFVATLSPTCQTLAMNSVLFVLEANVPFTFGSSSGILSLSHNALSNPLFDTYFDYIRQHTFPTGYGYQALHSQTRDTGTYRLGFKIITMSASHHAAVQAVSSSRRNSFDFVVDTANALAANDNPAGDSSQVPTPDVKDTGSHNPSRGGFVSRSRSSQPFDVDIEAQNRSFEEIELQEWPTESRLAAMHSSVAGSPSSLPRQVNVPSPTPVSTASTKSRGCGFWNKVSAMFGL